MFKWLKKKWQQLKDSKFGRWLTNVRTYVSNIVRNHKLVISSAILITSGVLAWLVAPWFGLAGLVALSIGIILFSSYDIWTGFLKFSELIYLMMVGLYMTVIVTILLHTSLAIAVGITLTDFIFVTAVMVAYYYLYKLVERQRFSNEMGWEMALEAGHESPTKHNEPLSSKGLAYVKQQAQKIRDEVQLAGA